jgi:ATP-binding cassette subfamily A (ABC1) protein 3
VPVPNLADEFDGSLALIWADSTFGIGVPSANAIMSHITSDFTPSQLRAVVKVATPLEIPLLCSQNYNQFSECYATISFDNIPTNGSGQNFEYTIQADGGLTYINVIRHTSDFEKRVLPLQWAVDQVSFIHLLHSVIGRDCLH